jgi:flagellar hook-length control protein FliK
LSAQVQARNGMVSEIVRGNLAQLRNALSEHGIQIDNFHVTSGDSGQQGNWQGFSSWEQEFERRQYQSSNSRMNNSSYTLPSGSKNGQQMENLYMDSSSLGIDHLV